jgi:hypothetical protein
MVHSSPSGTPHSPALHLKVNPHKPSSDQKSIHSGEAFIGLLRNQNIKSSITKDVLNFTSSVVSPCLRMTYFNEKFHAKERHTEMRKA